MNSTNKHALRVSVVLYCKRKATPALPCWVKKLTAALYAIPECFVPFATAIRDCGRTKLGTGWQPEQRRPPLSRRGGRSSAQRRFGGERRVQGATMGDPAPLAPASRRPAPLPRSGPGRAASLPRHGQDDGDSTELTATTFAGALQPLPLPPW
jgi:hypothetical protein